MTNDHGKRHAIVTLTSKSKPGVFPEARSLNPESYPKPQTLNPSRQNFSNICVHMDIAVSFCVVPCFRPI